MKAPEDIHPALIVLLAAAVFLPTAIILAGEVHEVTPDDHITLSAELGRPERSGPIGGPLRPDPSAAWRRAYKEIHGREWKPGVKENKPVQRSATSRYIARQPAKTGIMSDGHKQTLAMLNAAIETIQKQTAEIDRLQKRLEQLEVE